MPSVLTRQTVKVEPHEGSGAYGDMYGAERTVSCRKDDRRRVTRDGGGNEILSEATLWLDPADPIKAEDRVTLPDGTPTRVLSTKVHQGLGRPAQKEVLLS